MDDNIKALISKAWKKETADLTPGKHFIHETMLLTIEGNVERLADQQID